MRPRIEEAAERAVIGCILTKPACFFDIDLSSDEFQVPELRAVYKAISELAFDGQPVDPVTVAGRMRNGDADRVASCQRYAKDHRRIGTYAEQVRDASLERDMRACLRECQSFSDQGRELVRAVQNKVVQVGISDRVGGAVRAGDVSREVAEEAARRHRGEPPRVSELVTGVGPFDEYMALERGGVICVAGRPSMGKSTFARWLMKGFMDKGERIYMLTTESNKEQTVQGFIADLTGISSRRIASRKLSRDELAEVRAADATIRGWPLWLDDRRNELMTIQRELNRLKHTEGVSMVVVDHLQELRVNDRRVRDERGTVNALMEGLRDSARAAPRASTVILSQLNRKVESREDRRPMMSDLRESGKIEDVADMILLLYREAYYYKDADKTKLAVAIAKNRFGPTGRLMFHWDDDKGLIDGVYDEFGQLWKTREDYSAPPPPQRQAPQQAGLI